MKPSVFNLKTKPKKIKSKYSYPIIAVLLLALIIGYFSPTSLRLGQKVYYSILLTVINKESDLHNHIQTFFAKIETQEELQAKLNLIEPDYAKLQILQSEFTSLAIENDKLRYLLNIKQNKFSNAITAELIQQPNKAVTQEIYISFPKNAAISINQAVVSPQGLVGKIIDIPSEGLARVLLIHDKSFALGGQIKGTQIKGVLNGTNNPHELTFKPLNQNSQFFSELTIGTEITTRESSPIFPNYITIGKISELQGNLILIKPEVDFRKLKWLFILVQEHTANNNELNTEKPLAK